MSVAFSLLVAAWALTFLWWVVEYQQGRPEAGPIAVLCSALATTALTTAIVWAVTG